MACGRRDVIGQASDLPGSRGPGGDALKKLGVIHLLEAASEFLADEVAPSDQEHRRSGEPGGSNPGEGVGHPRPCRDHRDSEAAGEPGVSLGGVCGRLLVANVDNLDSLLYTAVEDGHDVAPRQGEDGIDPLGLERPGDDLAPVNLHEMRLCVVRGGWWG